MSTNAAPRNILPSAPDFNRPVLKRNVDLNSFQAQSVFNYAYQDVERALYVISALQGMGAPDLAEAAGEAATSKMDEYKNNLEKEKTRLQKLLSDNGIIELAGFRRPASVVAEITSPRANAYLAIILLFDELASMIFTLWLFGIFSDQQKENALTSLSKQVASARGGFSILSFRAWRAWQNRNRSQGKSEAEPTTKKTRGRKKIDSLSDEINAPVEVTEEAAVAAIAEATGKPYEPKTLDTREPVLAEPAAVEASSETQKSAAPVMAEAAV